MKLNTLLAIAALLVSGLSLRAQLGPTLSSNGTNALTSTVVTTAASGLVTRDAAFVFEDLYADLLQAKPFTTNGNATFRIGGGVNTATKQTVIAGMLTVPVSEHVAIGAVVAHIGSTWYEGGANVSFGMTNTWPVLGNVLSFAGDGVVYDFIGHAPANYLFTGFQKDFVLSKSVTVGAAITAANTSDRPGIDLLAGAHITWWW